MNQTAQGLAALGRGPDTMLVHMAPEEVAGLQALALKHGGTLTINPETGLAEAGFLKNILPMVAGFALGPAGFGLMSSAMAGLTVGGITALTSKSLEKGLMAGLGAYGGSGLGESLMGAGTGALSSAAGAGVEIPANAIVPQAPVFEAAAPAGVAATPSAGATASMQPLAGVPGKFVTSALPQPAVPATLAGQGVSTVTQAPVAASMYAPAESMGNALMQDQAAAQAVGNKLAATGATDTLGAGLKAVTASPSAALAFAKQNAYPLGALGIAALSGLDDKKVAKPNDPGMIRPYTYARTKVPGAFDRTANDPMSSRERQYFNDQYTALTPYKAPGPEYMAVGGPVEDMSNRNNMAAYMGQDKFDQGGSVGGYTFDPKTGLYTKPGGQGATVVSPTGDISGASGSSAGGDRDPQISKEQANFFNTESKEDRDSRARGIDRAIGAALGLVPGPFGLVAGLSNFANRGDLTTLAGGIANFFSPPGAVNYGIPVSDAGTSAAAAAAQQAAFDQDAANNAQVGASEQAAANEAAGPSGMGTEGGGDGYARGGLSALAQGGISNLGDYSDGGRLLRGPGDGVSDDIPAMIGQKQQARLADGEFVVPARIVSELGNGSTEAGARQLYAMMDRVQKARKKTVGKDKVATNSRAAKLLPA